MSKPKILVVDDEEDLCEILKFNLESDGYDVDTANSGEEALEKNLVSYDLLILDVMMGGISGFKLADMIRKKEELSSKPIIFITARDTENDMLTGFNIGADDYISKPFSIREVSVRVKAVLRRTASSSIEDKSEIIRFDDLKVDVTRKKVFVGNEIVNLTKKEFEMLLLLISHPGRVYSREDILRLVWSDEVFVLDRTIDVNITRLRKKLDNYGKYIVTRLGYGYCFEYL
jgi:two-component system, OmpR family, alkaline phosphatase synthesis response regulator PhoP